MIEGFYYFFIADSKKRVSHNQKKHVSMICALVSFSLSLRQLKRDFFRQGILIVLTAYCSETLKYLLSCP